MVLPYIVDHAATSAARSAAPLYWAVSIALHTVLQMYMNIRVFLYAFSIYNNVIWL